MPELSGKEKAAIFLLSIPPENAAEVLKHISNEFIEELSAQVASTTTVTPEQREAVFQEFHEMLLGEEYIGRGGIEHAKEMLTRAFGDVKARQIIRRLTNRMQKRPFSTARKADASHIYTFIVGEHPQIQAVLVELPQTGTGQLHPRTAAQRTADRHRQEDRTDGEGIS